MKQKILKFLCIYLGVIYLATTLIPLAALWLNRPGKEPPVTANTEAAAPGAPAFLETAAALDGTQAEVDETVFRLYDTATGKTSTVKEKDFLFGTLGCEMAPTVPEEALKAQTVAAYSYYTRLRKESANQDYDVSWNSQGPYVYSPRSALIKSWGENGKEYAQKLDAAIKAVSGEVLTYGSEVACAAFSHSSNGRTENAAELWGTDYPYLVSVASPYDTLSSDYEQRYEFTEKQVRDIIEKNWPKEKMNFNRPLDQWFSDIAYTVGGSVVSVNICGYSVTGSELREAFALSSQTFAVDYSGDQFIFRSKGNGHGVGMSQTGAVYMAAEGAGYREILNWYYPGTTLEKKA